MELMLKFWFLAIFIKNDSKKNMEYWKFRNWGALGEYSPLFVGLVCGFGVVLIIMSTIMLWRYCLLSAAKKTCCKFLIRKRKVELELQCKKKLYF